MKRLVLAFSLLLAAFAHADSLEQNVQAIEKAAADIKNAIQAKGGEMSGGLTNAADAIIAIPDKSNFDQTYIAWSNATVKVGGIVTNMYVETGYQLLPYLVANGGQFFRLTDIGANQGTFAEVKFTDLDTTGTTMLFGSRYNSMYEMHIYQNQFGFPFDGSWNDNMSPATPDAVLCIDGNKFYVDGILKGTGSTGSFNNTDYLLLLDSRYSSGYKCAAGKLHYCDIRRAINPSSKATREDALLLPALDPNGTICIVDVKSDPNSPTKYYRDPDWGNDWPEQPSPTNEWIYLDVTDTRSEISIITPYETTITNTPLNHLTIDDATRYLYQTMSEGL